MNYLDHIQEMGREVPDYPTLFAKYADTLIGARDSIEVQGSERVDWEAELAVVVGHPLLGQMRKKQLRRSPDTPLQRRIHAGLAKPNAAMVPGKAFDATTPLGPVLVTADEFPSSHGFEVSSHVNGELVQNGNTAELVSALPSCCPISPNSPHCDPET